MMVNGAKQNENASALHRLAARSAQTFKAVLLDIRCLYFVFRNPATPWYVRALLFLPLAYLCSPVQLIPNFIPVLGQMDDLFVIWLSNKLVRRLVDARVLQECRDKAAAVSFAVRFSGRTFYARHAEPTVAASSSAAEPASGGATIAPEVDASANPTRAAGIPGPLPVSAFPRQRGAGSPPTP
jgi:uncharacterized membrane protein YkvA (DUF1232 family)